MKSKISFVCQECGYDCPQWLGRCPECGSWNSLREIRLETQKSQSKAGRPLAEKLKIITPKKLNEIIYEEKLRVLTGFSEIDSVFGGGIVPGSVTLLAGDPGIGKSTLLLQIALGLSDKLPRSSKSPILYISGEESEEQIKLRAMRISNNTKNENFLLVSLTDTDAIAALIEEINPFLVIVDSIQAMESENLSGLSGSIGQVRYGASQFVKVAKGNKIPLIIIGHVTKEGMVAGPMVLSHMVDTVLFLEGEKTTQTRILRSFKNRFGPVDEVGIFFMEKGGMKEVKNPEQIFLSKQHIKAQGSALTVILEGTRSFLVELQALAVFSKLPIPRRVVSGMDGKRVELLLAVLQKHCNLRVDTMDIFVNVAGGIKVSDPAADLALCLAIFSSLKNISLAKTVGIAEVGLLGELREVPLMEKRIKEAKKLGLNTIISANKYNAIAQVLKVLK